ncbi:helix-turn-helix domain-containing protein [Nocardia sp. NPDC049220]|uniref:winged helix-turn-helix transcriptional regulator n=1 Tax=Nocardia sp. NPDC049220 TaxID=3155273 RepID=UPI0033CD9AD3
MSRGSKTRASDAEDICAITRTLAVLSDRWSFLILRDVFLGVSKFGEFRTSLGIASDVLSARLATLVEFGVLEKVPYHEPGQRGRFAYQLTPAGQELKIVLGALQQWGDEHVPHSENPSVARLARGSRHPLRVTFVDDRGNPVEHDDAEFVPTASYPKDAVIDQRPRPASPMA